MRKCLEDWNGKLWKRVGDNNLSGTEQERTHKKTKSKLGNGPIAFLDLPEARSDKITRKLLKVVPDNQINKIDDSEYGHTAIRFNGHDISGALDKKLIFSKPITLPSVPVELLES